jgi:hypothetical protein
MANTNTLKADIARRGQLAKQRLPREAQAIFDRLWRAQSVDLELRLRAIKQGKDIEADAILAKRAEEQRELNLCITHALVYRDRLGRPLKRSDNDALCAEVGAYIKTPSVLMTFRKELDDAARRAELLARARRN